ncbi:MAG: hypothetical protein ACI9BD_001229 [Candidatus Marinamargulisbacteria bacterium]|jgi:uncharacterized protein (TIGR03545 family)
MRKKAIVPLILILFAGSIFGFFFLDDVIEKKLIKVAEKGFGAQVDIGDIDISLFPLKVSISDVQVTDKKNPEKNLLELDFAVAQIQSIALLKKRLIVDEIKAVGLSKNTQRKSPGIVFQESIEAISQEAPTTQLSAEGSSDSENTVKKSMPKVDLSFLTDRFDAEKFISGYDLNLIKSAATVKSSLGQYESKWKKMTDASEVTIKLASIEEKLAGFTSKTIEIKSLKEDLSEIKQISQDLKSLSRSVTKQSKRLSLELTQAKNQIDGLGKAGRKDFESLSAKLGRDPLQVDQLGPALFGDALFGNLSTVFVWVNKIRQIIPKKAKKDEPQKITQKRGIDIQFVNTRSPEPAIWIKLVQVDNSKNTKNPVEIKLKNYASDQDLSDEPTQFKYVDKQIDLRLVIDHRKNVQKDYIYALLKKTPVGPFEISSIKIDEINLSGEFMVDVSDEKLNGAFKFAGENIQLNAANTSNTLSLESIIYESFSDLEKIHANGMLTGTIQTPNIQFGTNIDQIIADRVNALYDQKISEAKSEVKKQIDQKVDSEKKKLTRSLSNSGTHAKSAFDGQLKSIQTYQKRLDREKKELNEKVTKERRKIEEAVKKEKKSIEDNIEKELRKLIPKKFF